MSSFSLAGQEQTSVMVTCVRSSTEVSNVGEMERQENVQMLTVGVLITIKKTIIFTFLSTIIRLIFWYS